MSTHDHLIKRIRVIDSDIEKAKNRQTFEQTLIDNWTRERDALALNLTPQEKQLLNPPAPPAPAAQTDTAATSEQSSS